MSLSTFHSHNPKAKEEEKTVAYFCDAVNWSKEKYESKWK